MLNDKIYFVSERALYKSTGTSAQKVETSGSFVSISSASYLTVLNKNYFLMQHYLMNKIMNYFSLVKAVFRK